MTTLTEDPKATLFWMPGCSSCLRMKEFVESTGIPYRAVNVDEDSAGAQFLRDRGIRVPATCVGDECVNGVHLDSVASLLGVDYEAPRMLPPEDLRDRYRRIIPVLTGLIAQITPAAGVTKLPHRDRDLLALAGHASCVMRYFVGKYDDEGFESFFDDLEPGHRHARELIDHAEETLRRFDDWWENDGQFDPLDAVIGVYWGSRTLHEVLEREVWHTAQHTRQITLMLERAGITPNHPLSEQDIAGLPLPERVYD